VTTYRVTCFRRLAACKNFIIPIVVLRHHFHLPDLLPPLAIDGIFGPTTHARVVKFQDLYDIPPPRGLVGPRTQRALYSFVRIKHHILFVNYGLPVGGSRLRRVGGLAFGDGPQPSPLPPIPRTPFPFPEPFRLPQLPQLQLDPRILVALRQIKIEIEAGNEAKFRTTLGQSPQQGQLQLFADAKATVWSKPLAEGVDASAGAGVLLEKRLFSPTGETSAYFWIKGEVESHKVGPLTIAKMQAEGQIVGTSEGPPDLSATVTVGPEVEAQIGGRKVTLGPGLYAGITKDKEGYHVEGGAKFSATLFF
jgi:peptidoglycan hydrolase-like protein with peptidoglycan-binding domain